MEEQKISDVFYSEISEEMNRWGIGPVHISTIKGIIEQAFIESKKQDKLLKKLGVFKFNGCSHTKNLYEFSVENNKTDALEFFKFNKRNILSPEQHISSKVYKVEVRRAPPAVQPEPFEDGYAEVVGQTDAFLSFGKNFHTIAIPQNRVIDMVYSEAEEFKKFRDKIKCREYVCYFLTKGKNNKDEEVYFYLRFQIESVWSAQKGIYVDDFELDQCPVDSSVTDDGNARYIVLKTDF